MEIVKSFVTDLENNGDYSSNTIQAYSSDIRCFLDFLEGKIKKSLRSDDINSKRIKQFLEHERRSGFSASTLHRRKISLTRFAQYLAEQGIISETQLKDIYVWGNTLWKEMYRRGIPMLANGDIEVLKQNMLEDGSAKAIRDLSIISLILETGLAVNDIISINLSDLDLRNHILTCVKKTVRTNYFIKETSGILKMYLKEGRPELTQSLDEEALFVSQLGSRISRQGVWQLIKAWGEHVGLSISLSPRVLRNTAVMMMVADGLSIPEIQKRVGHSNRYSTRALVRKIKRNL